MSLPRGKKHLTNHFTNHSLFKKNPAKQKLSLHTEIKEHNDIGVSFIANLPFESWEKSVHSSPGMIFFPKTIEGVQNIIRWANANDKRIRASGYRHSSSELFCEDGAILISLLDLKTATKLPARHPAMDPNNEFQGIELVGEPYFENGEKKINCKIGAATCNYHFQNWERNPKEGNGKWTLPLNVIMSAITFGGSNAPMCHGAGISSQTISDLVTEIEFINVKGELQKVSDPVKIKAAAGCLGMLGIVTSLTLKLNAMEYADFSSVEKDLLAVVVPPPPEFKPSAQLKKHLGKKNVKLLENEELIAAETKKFINHCEKDYYSEWFCLPFSNKGWSNCWNKNGDQLKSKCYPGKITQKFEELGSYVVNQMNTVLGDHEKIAHAQTKIMSKIAMQFFPNKPKIICPVGDAIHFQHGIQNIKTRMMEVQIPIPDKTDGSGPDWSLCQKAWWDVLESIYSQKNMETVPLRQTVEMRVIGGSNMLLAPQYKNKQTCSIEVLTPVAVKEKKWHHFVQEILDKWAMLKDDQGHYLNIRPHWAKRFDNLTIRRDLDWQNEWDEETKLALNKYIKHDEQKICVPINEYLKHIALKEQIKLFLDQIKLICEDGGYTIADIQNRFSNPLLDDVIFSEYKEEARQQTYRP